MFGVRNTKYLKAQYFRMCPFCLQLIQVSRMRVVGSVGCAGNSCHCGRRSFNRYYLLIFKYDPCSLKITSSSDWAWVHGQKRADIVASAGKCKHCRCERMFLAALKGWEMRTLPETFSSLHNALPLARKIHRRTTILNISHGILGQARLDNGSRM